MTATRDGERGLLVVGASRAGLSAVQQLSLSGHSASVRVVGEEPYLPYDRPPMSKGVLAGHLPAESTQLVQDDVAEDVEWRLGEKAVGLDRAARRVRLADGTELAYERLLVATGGRAREWPVSEEAALDGVVSVRTV
jgi:NAD(P)H-nitrite reductase large subunit